MSDRPRLVVMVTTSTNTLGGGVELSDSFDSKTILELVPYFWAESVADGDVYRVTGVRVALRLC